MDNSIEVTSHIFQMEAVAYLMEIYEERSPIEMLRRLSEAQFQDSLLFTFKRISVEIKEPLSGDTLCLGLGIYHHLGLFVRNELEELKERNRVHDAQEKAFLLYCALNAVSKGHSKMFNKHTNSVISIALNLGADPNKIVFGSGAQYFSPWQRFLQDICDIDWHVLKMHNSRIKDFVDILLILLRQGADPEAIIEAHSINDNFFKSPFEKKRRRKRNKQGRQFRI